MQVKDGGGEKGGWMVDASKWDVSAENIHIPIKEKLMLYKTLMQERLEWYQT